MNGDSLFKRKQASVLVLVVGLFALLAVALCCTGCGSNSSSNEEKVETPSAITALTQEVYNQGAMSKKQAKAAAKVLKKVGLEGMKVDRVVENGKLDLYRGMVKGHQVNFTTDNKKIFYVQITGFVCLKYKWYTNWRGKLKYGIRNSTAEFDLYNTDEVKRGYIAKYDQEDNKVIPWSELK